MLCEICEEEFDFMGWHASWHSHAICDSCRSKAQKNYDKDIKDFYSNKSYHFVHCNKCGKYFYESRYECPRCESQDLIYSDSWREDYDEIQKKYAIYKASSL